MERLEHTRWGNRVAEALHLSPPAAGCNHFLLNVTIVNVNGSTTASFRNVSSLKVSGKLEKHAAL